LDYLGINSSIGADGFGATWQKVQQTMGRPVVITEFGCDSYWTKKGPDEEMQSQWLVKNWEDIAHHRAGHGSIGNSIGGFVFEWLDEWWKDTLNYFEDPLDRQSVRGVFPMPFPDGFAQEEWFGIMGQGDGKLSPFLRVPKKAYWDLNEIWNTEIESERKEAAEAELNATDEKEDTSE
jgi:beta-glucuronidase